MLVARGQAVTISRTNAAAAHTPESHQIAAKMLPEHEIEIKVRYYETDAQGFVHHANYLQYFELARVEQLLALGHDYAQLERDGILLVVNKISCKYHRPSKFGDTLRLAIRTVRSRGARIDHEYRVYRGNELLAEGESTLACIDREGRVQRLPEFLMEPANAS
jgi:acyl-CoA thioester hydrolase